MGPKCEEFQYYEGSKNTGDVQIPQVIVLSQGKGHWLRST